MDKLAFFDMDGTLVAPFFRKNTKPCYTFPTEAWIAYCNKHPTSAYHDSPLIQPIVDYAKKLKTRDYELQILTVVKSPGEATAKREYMCKSALSGLFTNIHFVENDNHKIQLLKQFADIKQTTDVILIEDNIYNVMAANELGFKGIHISHILTGLES